MLARIRLPRLLLYLDDVRHGWKLSAAVHVINVTITKYCNSFLYKAFSRTAKFCAQCCHRDTCVHIGFNWHFGCVYAEDVIRVQTRTFLAVVRWTELSTAEPFTIMLSTIALVCVSLWWSWSSYASRMVLLTQWLIVQKFCLWTCCNNSSVMLLQGWARALPYRATVMVSCIVVLSHCTGLWSNKPVRSLAVHARLFRLRCFASIVVDSGCCFPQVYMRRWTYVRIACFRPFTVA